jgi:hypothetical protein
MAPAGTHEFPEVPPVDLTPGHDGYRVWVRGCLYAEFKTLSNATRAVAALNALADLGALPQPSVHGMLRASVEEIGR